MRVAPPGVRANGIGIQTDDRVQPLRLNLLALPSLPVLYFGFMALSIAGVVLLMGAPESPMLVGPVPFLILAALVVRDYLIQPEREAQRHRLRSAGTEDYPALHQALGQLAEQIGLRRTPALRLADTEGALFVLGSVRHFAIAVGPDVAMILERDLCTIGRVRRRAEAALLHELEHIRQGDLVVVGLGRSLLHMSVWFSGVALLLMMAIALFSFSYPLDDLFTPEFLQQLVRLAPELGPWWPRLVPPGLPEAAQSPPELGLTLLFALNGFIPLIATVTAMAVLIWPRLLRLRELYADAGVALRTRSATSMWEALAYYGNRLKLRGSGQPASVLALAQRLTCVGFFRGWDMWRVHPSTAERERCLQRPDRVFVSALTQGLLAGLLATLLDQLSVGIFSVQVAAQVPAALPVLIGVLAASITLLPAALENRSGVKEAAWIIGCVIVCRMGWHLLNLVLLWVGVLLAPQWMSDILTSFVQTAAGALVTIPEARVEPAALLTLALQSTGYWLYLGVLLTVTLIGAVALDHALRRLVLTWYRLPGGLPRLKWVLTGTTAAVLALVVGLWLPLVALAAPISPTPSYSWAGWLGLCLVSQVVLLATILVGIAQARFAGRCPKCGQSEPGGYWPGRRCRACASELWEGLWQ